ncbi:hypothetical protein LMG26690_04975 [Achromobacter animicus]|uniref:Uncharacterized protein n=1 Tax=Achromobacter animicus TaxID=1389935 RepID=A0A6S7ARN0_9BURK|nr:hypothetical protein LMG26690_04975 [Achromobacter animicus]
MTYQQRCEVWIGIKQVRASEADELSGQRCYVV